MSGMDQRDQEKEIKDAPPPSFSSPVTDSLLDRIEQGDTATFGRYLEECKPALLAHIQRRMSPALRKVTEPQDIHQEVSLSAIRALSGVDLTGRDPFPWLCELAERRIVDAHRHHYRAAKRDRNQEGALQGNRTGTDRADIIDILAL